MRKTRSMPFLVSITLAVLIGCGTSNQTEQKPVKQEKVAEKKTEEKKAEPTTTPKSVSSPDQKVKTPANDTLAKFKEKTDEERKRDEQTQILLKNYLTSAKNYANQNKYEEAYHFVMESLKLMPDNAEALSLKKVYGRKLGVRPEEIGDQMEEAVNMVKVKIEQTKVEIENRITNGKRLMEQGKYEDAISSFKQAKEILRWMPYHVADLEGKAREVDIMIRRAEEQNDRYKEELKQKRVAEAESQAKREELARLKTLQDQVRTLFRQANLAFEREQYELAENFCEQVSILDPDNKDSQELVGLVREARHSKLFESQRKKYIEEWKKVFEHVESAMVPTQEIVVFTGYENWKAISKRGSKSAKVEEEEESPQDRKIREKLDSETLTMDFTEAPLNEVVDFLRTATGINIIIDPEVYKEFPEEEALKVDLTVNKLKLSYILDLILSLKRLAYRISNGVLIISTKKRVVEKPILRLYNVRDLTGKLNDFPAQELTLTTDQKGGSETGGVKIEEDKTQAATTITEEQLTDLIKNNIAKGTWEGNEGKSIDTRHGTLIIRQVNSVHRQIESLLNDLRKATGLLVTIETKFLEVEDNFLEDVGVDWRSLGATAFGELERAETTADDEDTEEDESGLKDGDVGTGYDYRQMDDVVFGKVADGKTVGTGRGAGMYYKYRDNVEARQRIENIFDQTLGGTTKMRSTGGLSMQMAYIDDVELQMVLQAVRKRSRSNTLNAPRLTVFNTQRANVTIVNQIAYVQDYTVEIATNATIADPVVGTVQDGVILDVRPIISADRKYITMELQPTVAKLNQLNSQETQLASSANSGPGSVKIELPDLTMTKIKTTVTIPDGGTLLLGGLMRGEKQDYMSGIPFLSDIPVLNFFASRRGKFASRRSLLILVTARITSMEEKEPNEGVHK